MLLVDRIGVPGRPHARDECGTGRGFPGIHRVEVEIAGGNSLFERDGKGPALCVGSAVSELGQIVINSRGYAALTQIVVAHVDAAGVDAEAILLLAPDPVKVVIDLPLRNFAALRIGVVVAADCSEGRIVAARGKHDGKGLLDLREVVRFEDAGIPACSWIELVDETGTEDMRVAGDKGVLRLWRVGVEDDVNGIGPGGLDAGVRLKAVPDGVGGVDGVVDL